MLKLEILCPYHGKIETLELPDSYAQFKGEVRCGAGDESLPIKIEIVRGQIISVERSI
ncbi:hypothetical protein ES703_111114 [subsurface metagenome]